MQPPRERAWAAVVCREVIIDAPREEQPQSARVGMCLRARPRGTPEQCQAYWQQQHSALVRRLGGRLGFGQYDQSLAVLDDPRAATVVDALGGVQEQPYLGFASLSFPSFKDLILQFVRSTVQLANFQLMQEELAFIDPTASPPLLGTRIPIT